MFKSKNNFNFYTNLQSEKRSSPKVIKKRFVQDFAAKGKLKRYFQVSNTGQIVCSIWNQASSS